MCYVLLRSGPTRALLLRETYVGKTEFSLHYVRILDAFGELAVGVNDEHSVPANGTRISAVGFAVVGCAEHDERVSRRYVGAERVRFEILPSRSSASPIHAHQYPPR